MFCFFWQLFYLWTSRTTNWSRSVNQNDKWCSRQMDTDRYLVQFMRCISQQDAIINGLNFIMDRLRRLDTDHSFHVVQVNLKWIRVLLELLRRANVLFYLLLAKQISINVFFSNWIIRNAFPHLTKINDDWGIYCYIV